MQRTILIIIGWLAVVLGTLGVFYPAADHAVYPAGGLVLCPLVAALSPLAAVSLMVWRLSAPLAKTPCHAARREAARDRGDPHDLRHFIMAGENDVGAHPAAGHSDLPAYLYVADPGG
jgi:hypothetical protein